MCRGEFPPSAVLHTASPAHDLGILTVVSEQAAALQKFQSLLKQQQSASSRIVELEQCMSGLPPVKQEVALNHLQAENQALRQSLETSISTEERYTKELEALKSHFSSPVSLKSSALPCRIQLPRALGS